MNVVLVQLVVINQQMKEILQQDEKKDSVMGFETFNYLLFKLKHLLILKLFMSGFRSSLTLVDTTGSFPAEM